VVITLSLPGVRLKDITKIPDERGFFAEVLREDWKDFLGNDRIVQMNLSMSYPGIIRAWHRHKMGQVDYFIVLKGSLKIVIYDDSVGPSTIGRLQELVVSEERLQVVRVPGHYWHGIKTLGNKPSLTLYCVTNLYDRNRPDEERRPWNDPSIIDPLTGKPYDWNKPPHR
jgi:dTDP-4-dehydrorhamnose 3,5-epimerase